MSFGSSDASVFSSGGSGSMNPIDTAFNNSSEPRGGAVGGFGSNGYSGNNLAAFNHSHTATFDTSGNMITSTGSARGTGRGRGSNYRGGGRGAGGNRPSPNKTYIAPGLSGAQQQYQTHIQHQQQPHAMSSLPGADKGSGYSSPAGAGRGRGGYNTRGRGGRGGAPSNPGGVPGQFRSLQWRPDNSQHQHQQVHQGNSQLMDSVVPTTDTSMGTPMQGTFTSAFGANGQSQSQHLFSAFSGHGNQSTSMQLGTVGEAGSSIQVGEGQGRWGSSSMGTGQSAFGGEASMSTFPSTIHGPSPLGPGISGFISNSTASGKQDSVFAVPVLHNTNLNSSSRPNTPQVPTTLPRPLSTIKDHSRTHPDNAEDADSRLARFTAVPTGNRYEEVRASSCYG